MSGTETTGQSADKQNRAVADEYFAAINDRDIDRAVACWTARGSPRYPKHAT